MTLGIDMNELPVPQRGERWTDGRGRTVRIHHSTAAHGVHSAFVTYRGVSNSNNFKHTKTARMRLDDFRKRFTPEAKP